MSSKTEKPTNKRLQDAAKKGQSFKSRDLLMACLMLCGVVYLVSFGSLLALMEAYRQIIAGGFQQDLYDYIRAVLGLGLASLLPILLLCIGASALPALLQSGFVLASKALKLNFAALNPVHGFKKLFSLRTLKDLIKTLLYLGCFVVALLVVWHNDKGMLFAQLYGSPLDMITIWRELLLSLVLTCLGCILIVLLLDGLAEYQLFMKEMKMDKHEVTREKKEQEGNPEIKARRREIYMDLLSEQVRSDIENSRLIIANPTHIAVGIFFKPELLPIPFISVLETNQRALAVRQYAAKIGIPVVHDIPLARRIHLSHRRYSFVDLKEVDSVLRLLVWLEQVEQTEQAEQPAPFTADSEEDTGEKSGL